MIKTVLLFNAAALLAVLTVTNVDAVCSSLPTPCNVWGALQYVIDPYCCTEPGDIACQNYKVEVWKCAAGATRNRNLTADGSPNYSETCGDDNACY